MLEHDSAELTREEDVKNDPSGPHITLLVVSSVEDFRGDVVRSTSKINNTPTILLNRTELRCRSRWTRLLKSHKPYPVSRREWTNEDVWAAVAARDSGTQTDTRACAPH